MNKTWLSITLIFKLFYEGKMPIYEYQCQKCKIGFSELLRCSEMNSQIDCPECRSSETKRAISSFAVGSASAGIPPVSVPSSSQFN